MSFFDTHQLKTAGVAEADQLAQFRALSSIFEALDFIVYVSSLETHELLFMGPKAERTFGAEWRAKRCYEVLQTGQDRPCGFCTNDRLVKDGVPQPPYSWEFRNTVNRRWYLCIDQAIPWVDGRLVRMEAAVDITERKQLERFREQYVDLVAHDLANPLNAIVLLGKTLERPLGRAAMQKELETLSHILGNARRMDSMIRDLHESVRLEQGTPALYRQPLSLVALAGDLLKLLPPEQRARVQLEVNGAPAEVLGDGPRLQRVLQNLLANAFSYSPEGATVRLRVTFTAAQVEVCVIDEGPGIAPEHLPRLFDRAFRVPGTRYQGLGLGLYIARLVVEGHGGQIEAESLVDRGACFRFRLPVVPAPT